MKGESRLLAVKDLLNLMMEGSRWLIGLERENLRVMVGILTRHCPLNRGISMIGQKDQSHCDGCGLEQTAAHFVAFFEVYGVKYWLWTY